MIRKTLTSLVVVAFLGATGLVSAQGTPSTTPAVAQTSTTPVKSTTTKVKHSHKHAKSKKTSLGGKAKSSLK